MGRLGDWATWGLLLSAAALEIVGDLSFKWWAETGRRLGLVVGLVVYGLALILFAHLLRRAALAVVLALWSGVAVILMALAGRWLFGEALSPRHILGILLVVGGIVLLQI